MRIFKFEYHTALKTCFKIKILKTSFQQITHNVVGLLDLILGQFALTLKLTKQNMNCWT